MHVELPHLPYCSYLIGFVLFVLLHHSVDKQKDNYVHQLAKKAKERFEQDYGVLMRRVYDEVKQATQNEKEEACSLCGGTNFLFELPILYCNGCQNKIKRGGYYHTNSDNKYHWCTVSSTWLLYTTLYTCW